MRHKSILFTTALAVLVPVSGLAHAEDSPAGLPSSCGNGLIGGVNCQVTKKDLKEAHEAYTRGVKLHEHQRLEDALEQFQKASQLVPHDMQFLTAREMVKAKLVFDHVERGNSFLLQGAQEPAAAEFRAALRLDPDNQFAQERLEEATRQQPTPPPDPLLARVSESE